MNISTLRRHVALLLILAVSFPADAALAENTAVAPAPRDTEPGWLKRHEGFVEIAKKQTDCQVLFIGDSITDNWRKPADRGGIEVWKKNFEPMYAVNFGISGDRTQHLLWRLKNGEIGNLRPKVIVMMIGTNNTGNEKNSKTPRNQPPEAAEGVKAIVELLRKELPQSKILLLAVFTRGTPDNVNRKQVYEINSIIKNLHDGNSVFYLDINDKFLDSKGIISKDIMPDLLHPNQSGYEIWADAIREPLAALMK